MAKTQLKASPVKNLSKDFSRKLKVHFIVGKYVRRPQKHWIDSSKPPNLIRAHDIKRCGNDTIRNQHCYLSVFIKLLHPLMTIYPYM